MKYTGSLFGNTAQAEKESVTIVGHDTDQLIEIQTAQLRNTYHTECLSAKQLKTALNIGETTAYKWLKKCQSARPIGRRKVVPIITVATYLVTGKYEREGHHEE